MRHVFGSFLLLTLLTPTGCKEEPEPGARAVAPTNEPTPTATAESDNGPLPTQWDKSVKSMHVVATHQSNDQWSLFSPGVAETRFRVFDFPDRMVVMRAGHAFELKDGKLTRNAKAVTTEKVSGATPLLGAHEIRRLEGKWPEVLIADVGFMSMGRGGAYSRDVQYVRKDGAWATMTELPDAIVEREAGVFLALRNGRIELLTGEPKLPLPKSTPAPKKPDGDSGGGIEPWAPDGACNGGRPAVLGRAFAARSSGEVYALGVHCASGRWMAETWDKSKAEGRLVELPGAPTGDDGIELRGGPKDHVVVAGENTYFIVTTAYPKSDQATPEPPFIVRLVADEPRALAFDVPGMVHDAFGTSDGTLWMLLKRSFSFAGPERESDRLVRVKADGGVTVFAAPAHAQMDGLWAADEDLAFTALENTLASGGKGVLFSTVNKPVMSVSDGFEDTLKTEMKGFRYRYAARQTAPAATDTANSGTQAAAGEASSEAEPERAAGLPDYTDNCEHPFVFLYDVNVNNPDDWTFPTTRNALRSFDATDAISLVEFVIDGRRRLGVDVKDADTGRRVVKHVLDNMKDEDPILVCYDHEAGPVRIIPLTASP